VPKLYNKPFIQKKGRKPATDLRKTTFAPAMQSCPQETWSFCTRVYTANHQKKRNSAIYRLKVARVFRLKPKNGDEVTAF